MKTILKKSWILFLFYEYVRTTEVTVASHNVVSSQGIQVALPVFTCHANHKNYSRVFWYKDYILLRNGSASYLSSHIFSLSSSSKDVNPLTLQGYFWCETDVPSIVHKYLFTIKKLNETESRTVNTYTGKILSFQVFKHGENAEKLKQDYEVELENILFGFLPKPNSYITDIKIRPKGVEVSFFVYSRQVFNPRRRDQEELIEDEEELDHILENISSSNETSEVEEWRKDRMIEDVVLRSTLGCYSEVMVVPTDPPKKVSWPYAYRGEITIPEESCSSKNGLAVTRLCIGSFYSGARWGVESGKCDVEPNNLTSQLMQMRNSDTQTTEYIEKILEGAHLSVTDLHILTDILTRLSNKLLQSQETISGIFSIIDSMLANTDTTELISAKNTIRFTTRILKIINSVLKSERRELVVISNKNIVAYVKSTEKDHVIGASILLDGSVEYLDNHTQIKGKAAFFLPEDLVSERERDLPFPCHLEMVFFKDWILFPDPKGVLLKRNYNILSSPVLLASLSGGRAWNLSSPIHLYFHVGDLEVEHPMCVYYDVKKEEWSTEGCEYVGLEENFYHCQCHHLSIFSVILSVNPEKSDSPSYKLGNALYVGLSVSMIALAFSILLYLLSKKWRMTVDHTILFHLSLSFLGCLLTLLLSEERFTSERSCFVISLILHYFLLAIFGWLLVHAIVHKMRFGRKTDLEEVPYFQLKAAFCTWGSAAVIILVIWITRDDKHYTLKSCLKPIAEVSRAAVIPIVILVLVALCLNLCAVYAITCRYKEDYLLENSYYHESVIKFRVAFTISFLFVITWLFGLFALHHQYKELRILFSICIVLTTYYMTLFFVFQETSLWEMCQKSNKKQSDQNKEDIVTFTTKPSE